MVNPVVGGQMPSHPINPSQDFHDKDLLGVSKGYQTHYPNTTPADLAMNK